MKTNYKKHSLPSIKFLAMAGFLVLTTTDTAGVVYVRLRTTF